MEDKTSVQSRKMSLKNYFRCTHKFDQHCQATKQVQRIHEEPPLYRTTYYRNHTCKDLLKVSQFVLDPIDHYHTDSSTLVSFNNNSNHQITNKQNNPFFIASFPSIKHEYYCNEEANDIPSNDPKIHNNQATSSNYLLSTDDHDHMSTFDHEDVISGVNSSCTASSYSLDMDSILVESVGFNVNDVLGFDFDDNFST